MKIKEKIHAFRYSRKKYIVTLILLVLVLVLGFYSKQQADSRVSLSYAQNLETNVVCVNDTNLTLRDLAFYVAYEENEVEKQAEIYYPQNTNKYWNLHIDGEFIKIAARNAAIQMAIHDEIFYQMAIADGVDLSKEEQDYLANSEADFWSDLTDDAKEEKLGITQSDIEKAMYKCALAQKYQKIYEELQGVEEGDYNFSEDAYQKLLEQNDCVIYKKVWSRIDFGNVTLDHKK